MAPVMVWNEKSGELNADNGATAAMLLMVVGVTLAAATIDGGEDDEGGADELVPTIVAIE